MKKAWCVVCMLLFVSGPTLSEMEGQDCLPAAMKDVAPDAWQGEPIGWVSRGTHLEASLGSGFARAKGFARGRKMALVADVMPRDVSTNNLSWAVFGVAGFENKDRYWHLALVRQPLEKGGRRTFEFSERNGPIWPAQGVDKLRELPGRVLDGVWEFGQTYRLEIRFLGDRVEGVASTRDGKVIYRRSYLVTSPKAVKIGAPALHAAGGFRADVRMVKAASEDCIPEDPEVVPSFPAYANGPKPISDRQYKATGFFRLEPAEGGRWRAIDPKGREVVPIGVNSVNYEGCRSMGPVRRYLEWNNAHYASREDWAKETLGRLKDWGFNRLSGGNTNLYRRGFMHSRNLNVGSRLCTPNMPQEFWICPNPGKPCAAFPNVFHPGFRAWCDHVANEQCRPNRNDPWLFGYYMDNELAWWGRGARDVGLYTETLKLPADHTARQALERFAAERGCTDPKKAPTSLRLDFLRLAADIYFRESTAAIRAADPNHLVLGSRFAGLNGAHEAVWEVAGKYCDLVTFNIYPWADLDRNVVMTHAGSDAERVVDAFAARYAVVKKPFLITEWSFPALDSGLPCMRGAGQRFQTQSERTLATELFARTMLASPSVLGYDYFMWVDEPPEGVVETHPEDTNYGLVSEQGKPYPLTEMFAKLHADIAGVRAAGLPAERPAPPRPKAPTTDEARAKFAVEKTTPDTAIKVPKPQVGKGPLFKGITDAEGGVLGDFTMMLSFLQDGSRVWSSISRVTEAQEAAPNRWRVVCEGQGRKGYAFAFTLEVTFFDSASFFLVDVVEVRNKGTKPLDMCAVYFRPQSPFALESVAKIPPNMWKRPCEARWQAADGRWFGARSTAATARRFSFVCNAARRSQHPDACFEPETAQVLSPGAAYHPNGTMWCRIEGGAHLTASR